MLDVRPDHEPRESLVLYWIYRVAYSAQDVKPGQDGFSEINLQQTGSIVQCRQSQRHHRHTSVKTLTDSDSDTDFCTMQDFSIDSDFYSDPLIEM